MATIEQQLTELVNQKNALADNLVTKGVEASQSETFNTLVPKVLDIQTGGGGSDSGGEYLIQVVDFDGTVLKSDHLDTGETFTLPNTPTHAGLTYQGWSSPVPIDNNTITVGNSDITIGAVYKTTSGLTEFDIELTKATGLDVTCNMIGNKNWGDGTTDNATTHTYTSYGKYTITCDGVTIPSSIFGQDSSNKNSFCVGVRIGASVTTLSNSVFSCCHSIKTITIPNTVTEIGNSCFRECVSLSSGIIPNSSSIELDYDLFQACYELKYTVIPYSCSSLEQSLYQDCWLLNSVTIPENMSSISARCFQNCGSIKRLTIPNVNNIFFNSLNAVRSLEKILFLGNVSTISESAFANSYGILEYDFCNSTAIPKLSNTNAFQGINGFCKIYVPDALYDDWVVATNWVSLADYIYKASEKEST